MTKRERQVKKRNENVSGIDIGFDCLVIVGILAIGAYLLLMSGIIPGLPVNEFVPSALTFTSLHAGDYDPGMFAFLIVMLILDVVVLWIVIMCMIVQIKMLISKHRQSRQNKLIS